MSVRSELDVTWLPADPSEGWVSMQRYWREMQLQADKHGGLKVHCPLGRPEFPVHRGGRWERAWRKNVRYPMRVLAGVGAGTVHLLDHSYAHLLPFLKRRCRIVVTVHDIVPLRDPGGLSEKQVERFRRRVGNIRKADVLISDSEFTKRELIDLVSIPADKIRVVPIGSEFADVDAEALPGDLAKRLKAREGTVKLLVVGKEVPRKNLVVLPEVLEGLRTRGVRASVVRVGDPLSEEVRARVGAQRVVECGLISDGALKTLYQEVDMLFFPSKLEGFGLPVLEAMGCGTPVVCSDASSIPEVGGDTVWYFDPEKPDEAVEAICEMRGDPEERDRRVRRGLERAAGLTWGHHFEALTGIYGELQGKTGS